MKQLTWKLVLPLTIITFVTASKWWLASVDNDFTEVFSGFPLPYVCSGWHTSLSLQIFITELVVDVLVQFTFWFILIGLIHRYVRKIKVPRHMTIFLWIVSSILFVITLFMFINPDNIYSIYCPYELQVKDSGWFFLRR